jgi:UTP-glucose-1-phosphate uridylyltransferase
VLPERDVGDIDFATTNRDIVSKLKLTKDVYADEVANGGYLSYSVTKLSLTGSGLFKLNVLIFKPDTNINTEKININGSDILCQRISDILYWKEKYNRTKDLIDIDAISLNMLEKAVFDKK